MPVMPDPLHPAIIHFPVVLILLGSFVACVAAFWRKHYVPDFGGGPAGDGRARCIGRRANRQVRRRPGDGSVSTGRGLAGRTSDLGRTHADSAAIAAVVAVASAGLFRFPRAARVVAIAAVLVAGAASYSLYQTGHRGGALVFRHGRGVDITAPTTPGGGAAGDISSQPARIDANWE